MSHSFITNKTVAGIVNGTSLVRGMLAVFVLFFFQFVTSWLCGHYPKSGGWLASPPLIIAFRGEALTKVMEKHRISEGDLYSALRQSQIWSINDVEVVAIEPTGKYTIYKRSQYPKEGDPDVILNIPGYKKLREEEHKGRDNNSVADEES